MTPLHTATLRTLAGTHARAAVRRLSAQGEGRGGGTQVQTAGDPHHHQAARASDVSKGSLPMNASSVSVHLDGDERVRVNGARNHDAIYIEDAHTRGVALVLGHDVGDPAAFLRRLAEAASDLADEINLRDLEAAS